MQKLFISPKAFHNYQLKEYNLLWDYSCKIMYKIYILTNIRKILFQDIIHETPNISYVLPKKQDLLKPKNHK